jgi:hypothetical protein
MAFLLQTRTSGVNRVQEVQDRRRCERENASYRLAMFLDWHHGCRV